MSTITKYLKALKTQTLEDQYIFLMKKISENEMITSMKHILVELKNDQNYRGYSWKYSAFPFYIDEVGC